MGVVSYISFSSFGIDFYIQKSIVTLYDKLNFHNNLFSVWIMAGKKQVCQGITLTTFPADLQTEFSSNG
jgi:hypothetical protein